MSFLTSEDTSRRASFSLRGRNPDVLTCIANLSSDEVFTPPDFANRMLDALAEAWAADNEGANIWADKKIKFLDPFTKSGVFLREITSRLTEGLEKEIPELEERVNHILTKQVYGIGITKLTSLLARRSLYCSKHANGEHSIVKGFDNDSGNIWFERTQHTWDGNKCVFCGAGKTVLDRGDERETHAYAFIHTNNIKARLAELFGETMQFDVIIGNPPYQLEMDSSGQNVAPIYNKFVEQAKALEPRYLSMVIPSRWMAGGKSTGALGQFREVMLNDSRLSALVDYPVSSEVFPGVEVKGGICYFLWSASHKGPASVSMIRGETTFGPTKRSLNEFDVFIRDPRAVDILKKVLAYSEESFSELVSPRDPYGPALGSKFKEFRESPSVGDIRLFMNQGQKRISVWVDSKKATKNRHLIDVWKVFVPEAASDGGQRIPSIVLGKPIVAGPPSVCTLTYLVLGPFSSQQEAASAQSYYATKFFRFLVSLRKITQHATQSVYTFVPKQKWSKRWSDEELYKKYKLTHEEVDYIEAVIRPMEVNDE
ncbi:Eco57I restriction-modification methylase domain-containing protein [Leucothrix pacifica]|uniref:site-specific DNA-methyltransferase (adenine-specific) n=1 Tax=Leucothrix pacifica TaxID=1247513 RepID=A0A317CJV1_9GAMM|nr:Eco57I restriction-modification methylase domain-containing protein [Leucothrix pacifica]PWQ98838.1 restriction endonuclease [Leucothrix pacifica]